jgi:peptide/nickel transport system permease protein
MSKYILKRLLLLIPTLVIVCIIVFGLMRMLPGDAVDALTYKIQSSGTYDVDRAEVEAMLGMDKPAIQQFFTWFGGVLRGDLGDCIFQNESVSVAIGRQLPPSLELGVLTLILTNIISIPLGLFCAARQDTMKDVTIRVISLILMSIPVFWIAMVVLIYPALWWGYSPPAQYTGFFQNPVQNLQMFLMPAFLGALMQSGMQLRTVRTVILDTMRTDYVRTAWAKGAGEKIVLVRHAFRNAMIPVITLIGGSIGGLIGGSVILENIFSIPGIGQQVITAIGSRDYPLVMGCILVFSLFTMIINLVVDISYKWIDPRVSLDGEGGRGN